MASKKPKANGLYKKWCKPSSRSKPSTLKNPKVDMYTEPGDNVTRPQFKPSSDS